MTLTGTAWNGRRMVTAPYGTSQCQDTSKAGHVKSCLKMGDHPPSLSTPQRPIANQYREGKVKSTPTRGVKQFLKPDAYKQWEPKIRSG